MLHVQYVHMDFSSLSKGIIEDIHVKLNFPIYVVPEFDHIIIVSAQTDDNPHWQVLEKTQSSCDCRQYVKK